MDLKQSLQVVARTGELAVGYRETIRLILDRKAVAVVASKKTDQNLLTKIRIFAKTMDVPVVLTDLSPAELGLSLRKPFPTSFIAVIDPGSSDILDQARSGNSWAKE